MDDPMQRINVIRSFITRQHSRSWGNLAIKEAVDQLPSGICFFHKNGRILLCNQTMSKLSFQLSGRELQWETEMKQMLEEPKGGATRLEAPGLFRLSDRSIWQFEHHEVTDDSGDVFLEYVASDVTALYEKEQAAKEASRAQREMVNRLGNIARQMESITREEEILATKIKVHAELGSSLRSLHRFYELDCPKERKAKQIQELQDMVLMFRKAGNEKDTEENPLEDFIAVADSLGVRVQVTGKLPSDSTKRSFFMEVIREGLGNGVRHGGATVLDIVFGQEDDRDIVQVSNNGNLPANSIVPGGGLTGLQQKAQQLGGSVSVWADTRMHMKAVL